MGTSFSWVPARQLAIGCAGLLAFIVLGAIPAAVSEADAAAGAPAGEAARADDPPNVVVILTDDQRTDSLERMPTVQSELVDRGLEFSNAGVPTSLCCPSRATILTGLFAHSTRVFNNFGPEGGWPRFESEGLEDRTIAKELAQSGYRTGLIGKYLNGFSEEAAADYRPPGWDSFVTFTSDMGYFDYTLNDGTTYGSEPEDYSTDVLAGYADQFIRSTPSEQPLFLYFAPWAPHRPFTPAPRHTGYWEERLGSSDAPWFDENLSDKPAWLQGRTARKQRGIDADLAGIQDSLMAVDDAVGRLLAALEETGRLDNTLVIYLSDNGVAVGEHHLRVWKNLPYRFTTDVPLVVRWDKAVKAGTVATRLALNVDVAPTIAAAAGVPLETEGLDLLGETHRTGYPLEASGWVKGDSPPRRPAYCGYRTHRFMFARYADGTEELYDYRKDPYELRNRAGSDRYADRLRSLRRNARETCRPVPPGFIW
jgi:N-acetylglucosamine-6-sulfatase